MAPNSIQRSRLLCCGYLRSSADDGTARPGATTALSHLSL